jgi:hypothetical protein
MAFRRPCGSRRGLRTGARDDGLDPEEGARLHARSLEALAPLDGVPIEEEPEVLAQGVLWADAEVSQSTVPGALDLLIGRDLERERLAVVLERDIELGLHLIPLFRMRPGMPLLPATGPVSCTRRVTQNSYTF